MLKRAEEEGIHILSDGSNHDDIKDYRPGKRALDELNIKSPLRDLGFAKNDIRILSKDLGLPTWDKPATPCLSSRFPYGHKITAEGLLRVDSAEAFIRGFGIKELRVRSHSNVARIEVHPEDFAKVMENAAREKIIDFLKSLGYENVTLDLRGFRSGSSNEVLKETKD